jgi:hypothetical protein
MTEDNEEEQAGGFLESKFWKVAMIFLAALLIFVGPTYVPYLLGLVGVDYFVTIAVGGVLFVVGIVLMLFLVRKKIIT